MGGTKSLIPTGSEIPGPSAEEQRLDAEQKRKEQDEEKRRINLLRRRTGRGLLSGFQDDQTSGTLG